MGSLLDQIKTGSRPGKPKIGSKGGSKRKGISLVSKKGHDKKGARGGTARPRTKMRGRGAKGVVRK